MDSPEIVAPRKPKRWVTVLVTIIVTLAAAWYTINRSERQAILAEAERAKSVKNNLVSIIEEHIINQKPMDCARLMRLIELKSQEERLITRFTARDIIEKAEYNIINSRYLDFKKKEEYKAGFDELYKEIIPVEFAPFKDIAQAELLNKLAKNIQERNPEESLNLLSEYVDKVNIERSNLEKKSVAEISLFEALFQKPTFYILMLAYFAFALVFLPFYMRFFRRFRDRIREK